MAASVLYGVMQERDLDPQTPAIQFDRDLLIHATQATLAEHNAEIATFSALWSDDTTDRQKRFRSVISNELQPGDEYTDPVPVKGGGSYDAYFPIGQWYTAWGATFVTAEQMTVQDVSDRVSEMLSGDAVTYRKAILSALLTNAAYIATDPDGTELTVAGLANGDAINYLDDTASSGISTGNQFSAQTADISDAANPFPALYAKLTSRPRNTGPYLALIASNLVTTVSSLTSFYDMPPTLLNDPTAITLNLPPGVVLPPSAKIIGTIGEFIVAVYPRLPSGVILAGATGGPKPLLRRQYPQANLQGFRPIGTEVDKFPFQKQRWFRAFGFGGWNRTGWAVHQIASGGGGTYAIPTGYGTPLGK